MPSPSPWASRAWEDTAAAVGATTTPAPPLADVSDPWDQDFNEDESRGHAGIVVIALIALAVWLAKESFWATRTDVLSSHVCQRRSSTTLTLAWKDVSGFEVRGYRVLLRGPSGVLSVPCWLYTNPGELQESILKAVSTVR